MSETDRRLGRDGFVRVPFLDPSDAAELRDSYGRLHGWNGVGFEVDFWHADPAYRAAAAAAIATATDAAVAQTFVAHRGFLRNFLVKWPGDRDDEQFPKAPHLDWAYTDERAGSRSWVVWLALEDITADEGQLRVARGSHRLPSGVRGMHLEADWLQHRDVWERRLLDLPVTAGEAVITDANLVHSSYPNLGGSPRVAVAVVVCPTGADLLHHRRLDGRRAEVFEVDDDFFTSQPIRELEAGPPDRPRRATVQIDQATLPRAVLAALLDLQPLAPLDRARAWSTRGPRTARSGRVHTRTRTPRRGTPSVPALGAAGATALVRANDAVLRLWSSRRSPVWDPSGWSWTAALEARTADIRAELEALAADGPLPLIADATGVDQGNVGAWRTFVLMHQGEVVPEARQRCPVTSAALEQVPGGLTAGFSVLEPGAHIPPHRGPDGGILRYHLGLVVPGPPGSCTLRVADEELTWSEGRSLLFDDAAEHEARNRSDADRTVLVMDVVKPLPPLLRPADRLARSVLRRSPAGRVLAESVGVPGRRRK